MFHMRMTILVSQKTTTNINKTVLNTQKLIRLHQPVQDLMMSLIKITT